MSDSRASGGSYITSNTPGDSVRLTFTGDSIALYRTLDVDGGLAYVYVDGNLCGYLQFYLPYTSQQRWQVPGLIDHLGPGTHTISIEVASFGGRVYIDAFAAPSPYTPTAAQQQALERINYYRSVAGIPPTQSVQALHQSAQAHAEFVANNHEDPRLAGLGFHYEPPDLLGYTGYSPNDRAVYFGYSPGVVGEDGSFRGDPIASVDGWMATVYHRNLIMAYSYTDMGYGTVNDSRGRFDALEMGYSGLSTPVTPSTPYIYTYPASGQVNVPHSWNGAEIPDPLPNKPKPVGYPVSLYIALPGITSQARFPLSPSSSLLPKQEAIVPQVSLAELRDTSGQLVPTYLLTSGTDPNGYLTPLTVFLIPQQPLSRGTTYTAHIVGTYYSTVPFDKTWSFTTTPVYHLYLPAVVKNISSS